VSEDVEEELRVGIGVDVSVSFLVEELAEVFGVDEVTVDAHGDTERGVDVEGLSFRGRSSSHGRVTNMAQAHVTGEMLKSSAIRKDLAGHPETLALRNSSALANSDTCSILSTMLEIIQCLVKINGGGGSLLIT